MTPEEQQRLHAKIVSKYSGSETHRIKEGDSVTLWDNGRKSLETTIGEPATRMVEVAGRVALQAAATKFVGPLGPKLVDIMLSGDPGSELATALGVPVKLIGAVSEADLERILGIIVEYGVNGLNEHARSELRAMAMGHAGETGGQVFDILWGYTKGSLIQPNQA